MSTKTAKYAPTVKFCPKLRQYENGIEYVQVDGTRTKITLQGYVPPTPEDEAKIRRMMEADKFCAITTWENREIPQDQKQAESEARILRAENLSMKEEMEALKEEMKQLKASKKG